MSSVKGSATGRRSAYVSLLLAAMLALSAARGAAAAGSAAPTPVLRGGSTTPSAKAEAASAGSTQATDEPGTFVKLDLPDWIIVEPKEASRTLPWILIVDDPQCPYCMQLHLALAKAKEQGDSEIAKSVVARLPFPLAYHDQSAHIVMDALCLESEGEGRLWTAASYLDWLIVDPWMRETGWKSATLEDLERDNGFFDSKYESHKVTSSRRREFQTERAKLESACTPSSCGEEEDCEKLCAVQKACREACPQTPPTGPAGSAAPAAEREPCLSDCAGKFVSARYRQFSKTHSACLLEQGAASAHARTAAAFDWAIAHKVPGTPTVYVGHPTIGFRTLGDSDHLSDFVILLRKGLADARARMARASVAR